MKSYVRLIPMEKNHKRSSFRIWWWFSGLQVAKYLSFKHLTRTSNLNLDRYDCCFSFANQPANSAFRIHPETGVVKAIGSLSKESGRIFQLEASLFML